MCKRKAKLCNFAINHKNAVPFCVGIGIEDRICDLKLTTHHNHTDISDTPTLPQIKQTLHILQDFSSGRYFGLIFC